MRIDEFNREAIDGRTRVSARVSWEDCDRPQSRIYFETDPQFAGDLSCNPNAFLLAAIIPAMHHGERRVIVQGKVCPQLRNGLTTAMLQLRAWYEEDEHPVAIEAIEGFEPPEGLWPQQTASFMSGGVDALATLRRNRLEFPRSHPGAIRDGFFVYGIDMGGPNGQADERHFKLACESVAQIADHAQMTLIPVRTNVRYLDDDGIQFALKSHAAILSSVAHAFSRRISTAKIAASDHVDVLVPWGSHPKLDPCYSSADVCIQHDGILYSRLQKVALVAEWDVALKNLRSCYNPWRPGDRLNCGRCEKCIRTMTELVACGKLKDAASFMFDDVSPDLLRILKVKDKGEGDSYLLERIYMGNACFWQELIVPLKRIGRHDLTDVIQDRLAEYDRDQARVEERDWRGVLKRLDRRWLRSRLTSISRRIRGISV